MRTLRLTVMVMVMVMAACAPDEAFPVAVDAATDAPPVDPFVGLYEHPDDFPRDGCVPGALAGFAQVDLWLALTLRTEVEGGALRTYLGDYDRDVLVPHLLTDDDLLVRQVDLRSWATLDAFDVCAVDPDGTLRGTRVFCVVRDDEPRCFERPVIARPFRRAPGEGEGLHLTLLGETNGNPPWPLGTRNVRVDGDLAYLARADDGVRIVDISDPAHPIERGHFGGPDRWDNDVKMISAGGRRYAVVASQPCLVIDVSTPSAPWLAAEIPFSAHTLFIDGTTGYFATGAGGEVAVFDLSNPPAPRYLGGYDGADSVHDLYVEGGIAYLSATEEGMVVVDLRDPAHPVELGREDVGDERRYWHSPWLTRVGGRPIIVHGDEGPRGGLAILDGDPASPTFLDRLGVWWSRPEVSIHNVMAFGARAYVAHYRDGVRVLDLSDPAAPTLIGYWNTWRLGTPSAVSFEGALGIDVDLARRRIYVADSLRGLMILEGDTTVFP